MAKTLAFSAGLGLLIAWSWGRLEDPRPGGWPFVLMVALGVSPVLLPRWRMRFASELAVLLALEALALLAAGSYALHARPYELGKLVGRLGSGFVDFYDVLVPFDGRAHPLMHGVLLLAVCAFTLLCALAVAARRPLAAILALAAGAGWPATILPGSDDLGRGAVLLVAALALIVWLRPDSRRAPPQVLAGTGLVVLALLVSSSGAVARTQFVDWENWDFYNKPAERVGVAYIWRSNYDGIRWPKKRTRVFTVKAPQRSVYWRATTLDAFNEGHWHEDLIAVSPITLPSPVDLSGEPLVPASARDPDRWTEVDVTIDALRDAHLVGPPQPIVYDQGTVENVQYEKGGIAVAFAPLARGDKYTVWGYSPRPSPAQLAKSPPDYPPEIGERRRYLAIDGVGIPPFGSPEHEAWVEDHFRSDPYRPLYLEAKRIAGKAKNPYAATVALEAWFRSSGGFAYDEHPPAGDNGTPALVRFVTQTQRGYCQHFAGAMALMLRYLGIPARVAAGFTSGAYDAERGTWSVNDRDAHTWVEVWFKGYGWLGFDPTPGRGTLGGSYTASSLSFDANGALKVLKASALKGRQILGSELINLAREKRGEQNQRGSADADRGGAAQSAKGRGAGAGAIVALTAVGLTLLFVLGKLAARRRRFLTRDPRRLAGACRRELVDFLLDQGIEVPRSAGPNELGGLLRARTGVEASDFADALGRARFGPLSVAAAAAKESRRELRSVRRRLRRVLSLGGRLRGLFSLRSILVSR